MQYFECYFCLLLVNCANDFLRFGHSSRSRLLLLQGMGRMGGDLHGRLGSQRRNAAWLSACTDRRGAGALGECTAAASPKPASSDPTMGVLHLLLDVPWYPILGGMRRGQGAAMHGKQCSSLTSSKYLMTVLVLSATLPPSLCLQGRSILRRSRIVCIRNVSVSSPSSSGIWQVLAMRGFHSSASP